MIHRLNIILKNCKNSKFRKGFVKYLTSLDFNEFQKLFIYYMSILATLTIKYKKSKFLSKNWFKQRIINLKTTRLFDLFFDANELFIIQINKNIDEKNERKEKILNRIEEIQNSLNNLYTRKIEFTLPLSKDNLINLNVFLIKKHSDEVELKKLTEELDILNKT